MNVRSESNVIGEVPAEMIRVIVNHDVVAIPVPVVAVSGVKGRNVEIESAKPEAAGTASH